MASQLQVKEYLAHWFQLGKKVVLRNGEDLQLPNPILQQEDYSPEFERCWQNVLAPQSGDCYLEGTDQTIAQLLSSAWEIEGCARCGMPVPIQTKGLPPSNCPCFDLSNWPDSEMPQPRLPINTKRHLTDLCQRLTQLAQTDNTSLQEDGR
ncbi:MAG: hypothetical protein WBA77_18980 [Microcoleaceae cyanobacterium]